MSTLAALTSPVSFHGGHANECCDHSSSSLEELITTYLARGYRHFALTQHLPPPSDEWLYPDEISLGRNAAIQQQRFWDLWLSRIPQLRTIYSKKAELFFGIETEFYQPAYGPDLAKQLAEISPDIIVASIHHVDGIPIDYSKELINKAITSSGNTDRLLNRYYDQQLAMFESLAKLDHAVPVIVGHLNLIDKFLHQPSYSPQISKLVRRNIAFAAEQQFVIEINARALYKSGIGPFPGEELLAIIADANGLITIGDDSHSVEDVGQGFEQCLTLASKFFETLTAFRWEDGVVAPVQLTLPNRKCKESSA